VRACILALATIALARAQTFEVSSVKPSASGNNGYSGGCHGIDSVYGPSRAAEAPPLGRCVIRDARLSHLIYMAYGLSTMSMLKGGPDWLALGTERFDLEAKAEDPGKTTEAQLFGMLRNLLAERFQLKFHREEKDIQGFALVLAKSGPRFREAGSEQVESQVGGSMKVPKGEPSTINARKVSMEQLANMLAQPLQAPVVDRSGLKGFYNFKLSWNEDAGPSLVTALPEQLGLRLEAMKVPASFFIVDSARRPAAN
jgi:uncharacterized protein (TIGR03435 family)